MSASLRSKLIRQVILWHWVSSGVCLGGMLLFTITGITLNHAAALPARPKVTVREFTAPAGLRQLLADRTREGRQTNNPPQLRAWLQSEFAAAGDGSAEWNPEDVYVSLPRPGGDAWVTIERASGKVHYEVTDRGWISYLNDLHKGRHTGPAWSLYIDLLAAACLVFTLTGLVLLQTHAAKRPSTWPVVSLSLILPVLTLLLFVHR